MRTKALYWLIKNNDLQGVRDKLDRGGYINVPVYKGYGPLYWATVYGHADMVELLLENGADPNVNQPDEFFILHEAIMFNMTEIVALLLRYGADIHARCQYGLTALMYAAIMDDAIVQMILQGGADPNACDFTGESPLYTAACYGCTDNVRLLIEHGADVNIRTNKNETPLHISVHHNYGEITKILLENGASVHARSNTGRTPLHRGASFDPFMDNEQWRGMGEAIPRSVFTNESLLAVLDSGANIRSRTRRGQTPLGIAMRFRNYDVAKAIAARLIQEAWRKHRRRMAAGVIQTAWIRAFWNPRFRVCKKRLQRNYEEISADIVKRRRV